MFMVVIDGFGTTNFLICFIDYDMDMKFNVMDDIMDLLITCTLAMVLEFRV